MKNITVSITEKTCAEGRKWAAEHGTSAPLHLSQDVEFSKEKHAETVQPQAGPINSTS